MSRPDDAALIARLGSMDSCAVSDALDSCGLAPAVTGLPPLSVRRRIVGPAVTVRLGTDKPGGGSERHLGTAAIESSKPGDIIVLEHRLDVECAGWGGVLSTGAQIKQVAGVVIDGLARDIDEALELQFPVYGRGATSRTARGRVYEQDFNCRIQIGGTRVDPGDVVLADSSGVAFVPRGRLEEIVTRAERIAKRERLMVEALHKGEPITKVVGRDYEDMLDRLDTN